ncbi:MAG: hypothetical protein ABR991_05695 [Terracidiphilus sp.]|jgi:hypothetical protein
MITKNSPQFAFWWRWLVAVTVGLLLFGAGLFLAPDPASRVFGLLFYSSPSRFSALGEPAAAYIKFAHGVLGAVLFGWSVTLLMLLLGPFRRASKESWQIIVLSLLAWFIPDTVFSLWSGFWQNAVLNTVIAAFFAVPLVATYLILKRIKRDEQVGTPQPNL